MSDVTRQHDTSHRSACRSATILVLSQVYVPDPASVGQHMADAAAELARRGWNVRVLASARGYDDPKARYPAREMLDGVDVRRVPLASFGKRTIPLRILGAASFLSQVTLRGLFTRRLEGILVSTSPPMCSAAALVISFLRRVPITFWAMDINPDQAVVMGRVKPSSPLVKAFDGLNRVLLRRARCIVALDRFMAERLYRKLDVSGKTAIMPPWPHDDALDLVDHDDNPFRARHHLAGKFAVMYSGNHSPANPLDTVIEAARRLQGRDDIVFMFIGGGAGKKQVEDAITAGATNIVSLPYQPMADLKYSLSAADVHVVTIGDDVVGIVHPCKVYGAMSVARPVLFVGPSPSHVADLLEAHDFGRQVEHGDVDGAVAAIESLAALNEQERRRMGRRAREAVTRQLSKAALCGRFCDAVERGPATRAAPADAAPKPEPVASS